MDAWPLYFSQACLVFIVLFYTHFWKENLYSLNLASALIFDNLHNKKSSAVLA
jgi:hypothetical protein